MRACIYILFSLQNLIGIILYAQETKLRVDIDPASQLLIRGNTNVASFELQQDAEQLLPQKTLLLSVKSTEQNRFILSQNTLNVYARSFRSNNPMALRDFKRLIKSNEYPVIKVVVNYVDIKPTDKAERLKGVASVTYTITGISKTYQMNVVALTNGNKTVIEGEKRLSIKDFGLEPPAPLMGMIKVSEWISIDLKLVCKVNLL